MSAHTQETPTIIPLRLVGGTVHDRDERAREVVTQLAIAHMVAGLRVLNRLRAEQGRSELTTTEIIELLVGHA